MITEKKEQFTVISTLDESDVIGMTVAQDSLHHIMNILANLYQDKMMAVLREYSCNARDSHIAAGNSMPIEVTLPTPLSPELRVKDYGIGLSRDDFEQIYSQYGRSTKSLTNDMIGSLGLGCKSALAYTQQFTVIGIKNGERVVVSVSKDDDGIGSMTIVDRRLSDESNGVEVRIPSTDRFEEKAAKLFQYWPKGTVLVNGQEPEPAQGLRVTDDIMLVADDHAGRSTYWDRNLGRYVEPERNVAVMAGVPYPIDAEQFPFTLPTGYRAIMTVPNGSLHFMASREALEYTKRTVETLTSAQAALDAGLLAAVEKEIADAATRPEALRIYLRWRKVLPRQFNNHDFKYQGQDMPAEIVAPAPGEKYCVTPGTKGYGKISQHTNYPAIDLGIIHNAMWVYGFDRTFTPTVKKKLWMYCDENNIPYPHHFILCNTHPHNPWLDGKMVKWEKINAMRIPRMSAGGRTLVTDRTPGSYDMLLNVDGDMIWENDVAAADIDPNLAVYYAKTGGMDAKAVIQAGDQLAKIEDDWVIVLLAQNRIAKFCRLFPNARLIRDVMVDHYKQWKSGLTEWEVQLLSMHGNGSTPHHLVYVPTLVKDPEIRRAKRLYDYDPAYCKRLVGQYHVFTQANVAYEEPIPEWKDPILNRYPLFEKYPYGSNRGMIRKHHKIYFDAIYQNLYAPQEESNV